MKITRIALITGALVLVAPAHAGDYGGGYLTRRLIFDIKPVEEQRHPRLLDRYLDRPISFAEGRGKIRFGGELNWALVSTDNGNPDADDTHLTTNAARFSRFGVRGSYEINENFKAVAGLKAEFSFYRSDQITDFDHDYGCAWPDDEDNFCLFRAYAGLKSRQFGTIKAGMIEPATYDLDVLDLSGSNYFAKTVPNTYVGGREAWGLGLRFEDLNPGRASGADRKTGVRYDSPTIAGFALSTSWGETEEENDEWAVALRYAGEFGAFRVAAGVGHRNTDEDAGREESATFGSASIMHTPTGLFVNGGYGAFNKDAPGSPGVNQTDDASQYHVQAGIKQQYFSYGKTTLSVDYVWSDDGARNGDYYRDNSSASTFGLGIAQQIDAAAMDLYLRYERNEGEIDGTDADDADTIILGSRIRF